VIRLVVGDDWQHGLGVKKPARCGHWGTGGRLGLGPTVEALLLLARLGRLNLACYLCGAPMDARRQAQDSLIAKARKAVTRHQ